MLALLEKAKEKLLGRQQKKAADFDALAARLAAGKKVNLEEITDELETLGRTAEELDAEVSRRQQRQADAAQLATVPAIKAELEEIGNQIMAEDERFKPLADAHQEKRRQLFGTAQWKQNQVTAAETMRAKLLASYRGPLTTELDENRAKQAELNREIFTAIRSAESHEHQATFTSPPEPSFVQQVHERGQLVGVVAESLGWEKVKDLESAPLLPPEEINSLQAAAKSLRETVAQKQKELDALVKREAEIFELMLEP